MADNDYRLKIFFPAVKLTMAFTDVTVAARRLEEIHQAGEGAGLALAEALAGAALLGSELAEDGEAVTLRMKADGPIGGLVVEANREGGLRGYTNIKSVPLADPAHPDDTARLFGEKGSMEIIRSLPGKIVSSASCDIKPVTVTEAIERYYSQSLQRLAVADVAATRSGGALACARGALVECMPDGDEEAFDRVHRLFDDNTVYSALLDRVDAPTLCKMLRLPTFEIGKPEPLRFACPCSEERVRNMLLGLPAGDREEIVAKGEPVKVRCHMCGRAYEIPVDILKHDNEGK